MNVPNEEPKWRLPMIPMKDFPMWDMMQKYGGSFVQSLAYALAHADPINYMKLEKAFPEYFAKYRKMAENKNKDLKRRKG